MKQARLDQLADGIFAIVMTILVFEIRIPEYAGIVSDATLVDSLRIAFPSFMSYVLSFFLLFTYWRSHHFIQSILAKNIDTHFTNLNAVFFLFVGLVPFSASFLGKYSYSRVSVVLFAVNIILIGISLYVMREYVLHSNAIDNKQITRRENEHANMHILFPVFAAVVAILISYFNIKIAVFIFTIAIMYNLLKKSTRYTFAIINLFRNTDKLDEFINI